MEFWNKEDLMYVYRKMPDYVWVSIQTHDCDCEHCMEDRVEATCTSCGWDITNLCESEKEFFQKVKKCNLCWQKISSNEEQRKLFYKRYIANEQTN